MRFNSLSISIVCLYGVVALGVSCKQNTNNTVANVIYYYPAKNVYYDSVASIFYYSLDSAKTWDSMKTGSAPLEAALGPKIAISRTDSMVWLDNDLHRQTYKGIILNIVNRQTIALSKVDRINRLRAVVKTETSPEVVEKKEPPREKGLKRFFNKLFGRKKKGAADTTH